MLNRRQFLQTATATAALAAQGFSSRAMAQQGLKMGAPVPFSFDDLKKQAEAMARSAYVAPPSPSPDILFQIDYDAHGKIKFKTDLALWADGPSEFPVTFFHMGRFFQKPVRMHVVENGQAREIIYDTEYFDMPADSPARKLPDNTGFAGFRFQEPRSGKLDWKKNDWVAFLGASYFRAIGELYQYGLSARGLAVDVAVHGKAEEFPDFTHVYFETPQAGSDTATVYALLDGPSVAGAYRFVMKRAASVTMDLDSALFLRKDIQRLGIAPLTSMYWYSEKAKTTAIDWRPEIHDSDGLAMWTGTGEHIWRPLNNPPRIITSAFSDENPKGFGLLQRDRNFDHYLDGVYYDRRPSLWIEPQGSWGKGTIQLVEIPTDDEIHDNIVAMWVPAEPARAGQALNFRYRMHWSADEPYPTPLARVIATRFGNGGQAGTARPKGVRKFMVEFIGEPLTKLPSGVIPKPVFSASRGEFSNILTEAVPNNVPGHWRTQFDLTVTGTEPVEMRCYLRNGDEVLSETWLYQYHPAF
ncbi:glucan biosynthesis protein D [Microvirga sp. KLBC 81]|uniref:glucan biosynthesis protein n=1 Tax=Microvirga sp. KLBC 81 TaxID=1862707 RepID=UPI000D506A1B|nr:glucan biosynthesis protein D [Microvirga sp. KLBC 81]PVE24638.1 glucan biosynthesis protein D [Microvirga sp. KLBC 81]